MPAQSMPVYGHTHSQLEIRILFTVHVTLQHIILFQIRQRAVFHILSEIVIGLRHVFRSVIQTGDNRHRDQCRQNAQVTCKSFSSFRLNVKQKNNQSHVILHSEQSVCKQSTEGRRHPSPQVSDGLSYLKRPWEQ